MSQTSFKSSNWIRTAINKILFPVKRFKKVFSIVVFHQAGASKSA
jgi:hypothetical protein